MSDPTEARRTAHRRVYEGKVLSLDVDEVEEPGGVKATREVVRHAGSVATLAVDDRGRALLVRQFRYAVGQAVWELPAGRRDGGEAPEAGARRELIEETGVVAAHMELLAEFFTTPGFCDERMWLFRASGLTLGIAQPGRLVDAHLHHAVGLLDRLLGHALQRALHERDPDRQRSHRAGLVAAERARLVEADPRHADDRRVESAEPRIDVLVGRAGLAR